jgi:hypothetical protein
LDPSGSPPPSETGYFYYVNYKSYEIGAIQGKNAVEHAENTQILIKKLNPLYIAWETGHTLLKENDRLNKHFSALLHFAGMLELITKDIPPTHKYKIYNHRVVATLNNKEIGGLELRREYNPKLLGAPKKGWYFNNKEISIHQRDALTVFFIVWTDKLKRPWPWTAE